jgi:hypothetical protein
MISKAEGVMAEHTPGPWVVGEVTMLDRDTDNQYRDPWHAYVHDNGCLEANVSSDRAFADATLIAAAPDMLAVLQSIHALCRARDHAQTFTTKDAWDVITAVQNSAEAAIAKAKADDAPAR